MKLYKIKDIFVGEVVRISRKDNLIDLVIFEDPLILIKRNDKYYDLFSNKEFLKKGNEHFMDNTFYIIKKLDDFIYYDFLTNKELILGLVSEDRLRVFSNKINSDNVYVRKRILQ